MPRKRSTPARRRRRRKWPPSARISRASSTTSARTTTRKRRWTTRCPRRRRRRTKPKPDRNSSRRAPRIRPGRPSSLTGLLRRSAEDVGVAVVDLEHEAVDRDGVDPAALEAPAVLGGIPRAVLAAVARQLLMRHDRRLHRFVPLRPEGALGAVELEERERRVVPVVEIHLPRLPRGKVASQEVDRRERGFLLGLLDEDAGKDRDGRHGRMVGELLVLAGDEDLARAGLGVADAV